MKQSAYISQQEETEVTRLEVVGAVPDWLTGTLIRNGPALFEQGETSLRHWFDGYGLLHAFSLEDGEVTYHSRFIESKEYTENILDTKKRNVAAWGTSADPCRSIFQRFFAMFVDTPTNTNVSVIRLKDKYYTTSDISVMNEFDAGTLETKESFQPVKGAVLAAHPSFERDGSVLNLARTFGPKSKNSIISYSAANDVATLATFYTDKHFYAHSFANEEKYFVAIEQPLYVSFPKLMQSGVKSYSFYECLSWEQGIHNSLHVYNKESKEYIHIPTNESFFFFHTINSYQKDDTLVIDFCGYTDSSIISDFYLDTLKSSGVAENHKPRFMRLILNLKTKEVTLEKRDVGIELPNIHRSFSGKDYRFAYGVHSHTDSKELSDSLIKYDIVNNISHIWKDENLLPGEPVFIPSPEKKGEDDGVLMTICFDGNKNSSCLVILDAQSMKEISRAYTPLHIPAGLHGNFYTQ